VLHLCRAIRQGDLDRIAIPEAPLDILAQQVVAMCAAEDWNETELFKLCAVPYPYRDLARADFDEILGSLRRYRHTRGRYAAYLHRDRVTDRRAPRASRLAADYQWGAPSREFAIHRGCAARRRSPSATVDEDFRP